MRRSEELERRLTATGSHTTMHAFIVETCVVDMRVTVQNHSPPNPIGFNVTIQKINTEQAPAAIGPYSQAVVANGLLFASGQIPLDPSSGEIVEGGVPAQTTQVLENLKAVLQAGGSALSRVVKITIYITDIKQFATVNEIYGTYFSDPFPARACVEVSALPKGVEVEMDAIALLD